MNDHKAPVHLDIEIGDLVSPVRGSHTGRIGQVIDIRYVLWAKDTLAYTMIDVFTQDEFMSLGSVLKLLDPDYLPQQTETP